MRRVVASSLLLALVTPPVTAQGPQAFFARHEIVDAAAAPEGSLVAYTLRFADPVVDSFRYSIEVIPAKGGAPWELGPGRQPAFAPKGQAIAWLARRGDAWQLLVRDSLGGADRQLTDLPAGVATFRWSPDGTSIALAADASAPFPGGHRFDGGDRNARRSLYLVASAGGAVRRLTGDDFAIGPAEPGLERLVEYDWLGDSSLVVSGRIIGGEEPREGASLFVVDIGDGSRRYLAGTGGRWHLPVVSPDREWIAFTGQPVETANWSASELIVLHPDGSGLKRLTVGLDRDVLDLAWHGNRELWFVTEDRGSRNIQKVDVRSGKLSSGTSGLHLLSLQSIPAARRLGAGASVDARHPGRAGEGRPRSAFAVQRARLARQRPAERRAGGVRVPGGRWHGDRCLAAASARASIPRSATRCWSTCTADRTR